MEEGDPLYTIVNNPYPMAKVRRMEKVDTTVYVSNLEDELEMSKYTWMCLQCGRVWLMQATATNCPHKDQVSYGLRKFPMVRRENPLQYAKGKEVYRAVQYETFERLNTKPEDWVWTGRMTDLGPIGVQIQNAGNRPHKQGELGMTGCDLCGFSPLRYVFEIETVTWAEGLTKDEKMRAADDFTLMKKTEAFKFNGKHSLGIGSECITNYMLATPALREKFEEVKKVIQKTQRTELQKKKAAAFAEKYPDVEEMLDEIRPTDKILNMKFKEKWDYRLRDYMPQEGGINKTTSIVYRMEKALKTRGFPSPKLQKAFEDAWKNREARKVEAKELQSERDATSTLAENVLLERSSKNKRVIDRILRIHDSAGGSDRVGQYELDFVEDMYYRLGQRPDMRVSPKQANWLKSIEDRIFPKELEGAVKDINMLIGIKLANLGIKPNDWELDFLKTVAKFVSQERELTDKMQDSWNRLFKGKEQSIFAPKDMESSAPQNNTSQPRHSDENSLPQLDLGVYELPDGSVYVVTSNKEGTRLYAKKLVVTQPRLNANNVSVDFDFVYDRGAIYNIKPEHKMSLERAKKLTIQYGRCIRCGRHLKAAESVERGIGPVCIKAFQ